jgi:RNA 2',3'-cyclic 3'-phosphodiesterase
MSNTSSNASSDSLRLFFALWPDETLRAQLAQRMAALPVQHLRLMNPLNLHVTLAFLGSTSSARLPDLSATAAALSFEPCTLLFDQLTVWRRARVLVLSASQVPPALLAFTAELQARLRAEGFALDNKPFRPHVTLARDVHQPDSETPVAPLHWPANDFVLVQSVPAAAGVRYEVLARFSQTPKES